MGGQKIVWVFLQHTGSGLIKLNPWDGNGLDVYSGQFVRLKFGTIDELLT